MAEKTKDQLLADIEKLKQEAEAAKQEAEAAKAEAASLNEKLNEINEPTVANAAPYVDYNEKIKYTPPLVPGILEEDLIVIHKGVSYQMKRGMECEIPLKVYNTVKRSDKIKLRAKKYADEQRERYLAAQKELS